MDELKHNMAVLRATAERIEGKVDRIDGRTVRLENSHENQRDALDKIADALEKIAEKHSGAMVKLALGAITLLAVITAILILAFTQTSFTARTKNGTVEVGK